MAPVPAGQGHLRRNDSLTAIGRLRNGVKLEQAQAELATLTPSHAGTLAGRDQECDCRNPAARRARGARARAAVAGVCRRRARSAGGLRERGQPHARARDWPRPGIRRARRARLGPIATGASAPGRESRAGVPRWSRRIGPCSRRNSRAPGTRSRRAATGEPGRPERRGVDLCSGRDSRNGSGLRHRTRSAPGRDRRQSKRCASNRVRRQAPEDWHGCAAHWLPPRWRSH